MPAFEIIKWNETNFPLQQEFAKSPFLKACYERQLWAFVADYMRVYVLEQSGGIYLDTDVYLLKDLSRLCTSPVFLGFEHESWVNASVLAAVPESLLFKKLLRFYREQMLNTDIYTIPQIITSVLQNEFSLQLNGQKQQIADGISVYPKEYFYPYYSDERYTPDCIGENTYAIHWWAKSWKEGKGMEYLHTKHLRFPKKQLKRLKLKFLRSLGKF